MAVSGRKLSDFNFRGSLSKGPEEDFEHTCVPCLTIGEHLEAHAFCEDCQEYLCKSCVAYHQRIKALKHHQLLDKDNMDRHSIQSKDSAGCSEKCHIHENEVIKFFCPDHEFLGCTDCITLNHRTCKIEYIPDKCAGIGDSAEYRETVRNLYQKMIDMDAVIKKANLQDKKMDSSYDHVIKEILQSRKEINNRLDELQNQILTDAEERKFKSKETVKMVLEACTATSSDTKKFMSSLQNSKTSQQNGELYITLKQAKSKLRLGYLKDTNKSLEAARVQFSFERNTDLQDLLIKQDIFGKLSQLTICVTPRRKKAFDKLTDTGDVNVRTQSDEYECCITGCAVLSPNKLVLADMNNKKLKVVDTQSTVVIEEKSLDSWPRDIAVLPRDQIAVTMPMKMEILITTAGTLSTYRKIPLYAECRSITYNQGQLYVICLNPTCVVVMDTQANINNEIPLDSKIFDNPNYIQLSEDARHIYISNYNNKSVVSVTLQGEISAVYKHVDLNGPVGMMMLEDGSLLVGCNRNNTIHHISGDLKQGRTVLATSLDPWSILYNRHKQEVYIGGDCDQLKIMDIAWKE